MPNLVPVSGNPFAKDSSPRLVPVEGNPFAKDSSPRLVPIEGNPFAGNVDGASSSVAPASLPQASPVEPIAMEPVQPPVEAGGVSRVEPYSFTQDMRNVAVDAPKAALRSVERTEGAVGSILEGMGDYFSAQGRQFRNTVMGEGKPIGAAYRFVRRGLGKDTEQKPTLQATPEGVGEQVAQVGQQVSEYWNEAAQTGWEKRDPSIYEGKFTENPSLARITGGAIESSVPMLTAFGLAAGGAPNAGAILLASTEAAPVYSEAKQMGASDKDAFSYALLSGAGTALLEKASLGVLTRQNPVVNNLVKKLGAKWYTGALVNFAAEGSQEAIQEIYQNAVAMGYDGDRELLAGALEAGLSGGLLGGAVGVAAKPLAQKAIKDQLNTLAKETAGGMTEAQIDQIVLQNMAPQAAPPVQGDVSAPVAPALPVLDVSEQAPMDPALQARALELAEEQAFDVDEYLETSTVKAEVTDETSNGPRNQARGGDQSATGGEVIAAPQNVRSEKQQQAAKRFGNLTQAVDQDLSTFRSKYRYLRKPEKSDPLYADWVGTKDKPGIIAPWRWRNDSTLPYPDQALEFAKQDLPDRVAADASDPAVLGGLYAGRLQTVGQQQKAADAQRGSEELAFVHADMLEDVQSGILPPYWMQEQYPDIFERILNESGAQAEALEVMQVPDEALVELDEFLAVMEQAEQQQAPDALAEWKRAHGMLEDDQAEMFGKGAVGDVFELRPEVQQGKESFSERIDREQRGRDADAAQQNLFEQPVGAARKPPSQDLTKQAATTQQGGFVQGPTPEGAAQVGRSVQRLAKRWLTPSAGLDPKTRALVDQLGRSQEAARVEGMFQRKSFQQAKKQLVQAHSADAIQAGLEAVVYGEAAPAEFARQFGLAPDALMVQVLEQFDGMRRERSANLQTVLKATGNKTLAEKVGENEAYVSRMYLKHAMGDAFAPDAADYTAAVAEVRGGMEELLERLGKRADKAAGKKGRFQQQVVDFLNTRDPIHLDGLSESRAAEISALGKAFSEMSQVVEGVKAADGGGVEFLKNATALQDAAQATIDYYLNRTEGSQGGGNPDVSNLKKRFLGEAFRKLYGEVRDPVFAAAITAENQANLLAQLTFFNRLAQEAENVSWSKYPSKELGTEVRLDDDRRKYGLLAGKFVTPELDQAIHGDKSAQGIQKIYENTLSTMRMLKLVGPKTIVRNYVTGLAGFAMGSGDMFRDGYWKNFDRGNRLAKEVAQGKPAALQELQQLVELGVFSFRGNTQMEEVQRLFTLDPRKKAAAVMTKLGDLYSLIDLPTKAAGYYTALERTGDPQAAAEHVQKFYQNPADLPRIAGKLSKLPLSDYPGYFFDATRIRVNQVKHAGASAKQGDLIPALGMTLSGVLAGGMAYGMGLMGRELWRNARRALRGDDEDVKDVVELEKPREVALRSFMPDYYQKAPLFSWQEDRKDGSTRLYYTVTGGNSAFPLEDQLVGALQASQNPKEFAQTFASSVAESRFSPGMLPQALYKFATGDDLKGGFQTTGITDVVGRVRPDKDKIFADSSIRLLSDIYGGQFGSKLMQLRDVQKQREVGAKPAAGSYSPYTSYGSVLGSMIDPARTYEIDVNEASRMVRNKISPYREGLSVSKWLAGQPMKGQMRQGAATEEQEARGEMGQEARKQYIEELGTIISNADQAFKGLLGVGEYVAIIRDSVPGVSMMEVAYILNQYPAKEIADYMPQPKPTHLQKVVPQ